MCQGVPVVVLRFRKFVSSGVVAGVLGSAETARGATVKPVHTDARSPLPVSRRGRRGGPPGGGTHETAGWAKGDVCTRTPVALYRYRDGPAAVVPGWRGEPVTLVGGWDTVTNPRFRTLDAAADDRLRVYRYGVRFRRWFRVSEGGRTATHPHVQKVKHTKNEIVK